MYDTTLMDISAVITTYNRAGMLATALQALLRQHADGLRYEIVVVDNNSTDNTRAAVESLIAGGHTNLRYVFEPKQGISQELPPLGVRSSLLRMTMSSSPRTG
jgi:glycosyltransferase involved in cell wall biosynthesis